MTSKPSASSAPLDSMWVNVSWMPHSSLSQNSHVTLAVRSLHLLESEDEYWLVIKIFGSHLLLGSTIVNTATVSSSTLEIKDTIPQTCNKLVQLPIRWRDLPRDANLMLQVMGPSDAVRFQTSLLLFDKCGKLKAGLQKLELQEEGITSLVVRPSEEAQDQVYKACCVLDELERFKDDGFGQIPSVPWLDNMLKQSCEEIIQEHKEEMSSNIMVGNSCYVILELPRFDIPVMHEEAFYPSSEHTMTPLKFSLQKDELVPFLDFEIEGDNPVEDKYRCLAHDLLRGLVDPALKPDKEQRALLANIIASPSHHPSPKEKDLLWRFRFSLVDNRRALTKFLLAVDWTVESEVVQAAELLEQWRKRSPIEVTDALKLLGKHVAFQTSLVRTYAIDTLAAAPDDELTLYLLQLVQALKYENNENTTSPTVGGATTNQKPVSSLATFLIDRASQSMELANYLYWYLKVELQDPTYGPRYREVFDALQQKLSTSFATHPADVHSRSPSLKKAIVDSVSKMGSSLRAETPPSMWEIMVAQDKFISALMECQMQSREARGKKDSKEAYLRDLISSEKNLFLAMPVPLPSSPHVMVNGLEPHTAKMFKSALYPALIEFCVSDGTASDSSERQRSTYKVIVKTGDDLRQDQLVIMLIKLMDGLLKRGTLDLCLKPYSIIATSPSSGLVEFVDGSAPISHVLASHNNSILQFFQTHSPQQGAKHNVKPDVLQTYLRSCAGYCVITYIIGVGDRHLDNILLQPSGHFFHIDFGFIFGRDPKPLPPAFRLTREMVDGMGGVDSAEYRQFCSLACQAFNLLRKSAGLVLNLLHLMSDAGIEDLSNNPSADAEGVIAGVEERFRLELTDEQAEKFFLGLINDSLAALAPRVMDVFHSLSVARR